MMNALGHSSRTARSSLRTASSLHRQTILEQPSPESAAPLTRTDEEVGLPVKPRWIPFAKANHGPFLQEAPVLHNQFLGDSLLRGYLKRYIPKEVLSEIENEMTVFGGRVAEEIYDLHLECERDPPRLVAQDAWGVRRDQLLTCAAWRRMKDLSAQEGLVALGYQGKQWSRLYQMAKLYIYAPSSGLYTCPLAMTDGAAKTIETLKLENPVLQKAFRRLTSFDPGEFWTSGQWMTERGGGSDVGNGTETVAIRQADNTYRLYGYKWFSSAMDSNMALALARIKDQSDDDSDVKPGLTMFFLETKGSDGAWNGIQTVQLKNKLGTRQVPTAELLLDGVIAHKISENGRGVSSISHMLSMTRIHNAIGSVSAMRRMLSLSRDYSQKRWAFGRPIAQYPLHMQTLARMEMEVRGSFLLLFKVVRLLGAQEMGKSSPQDDLLLRILTPILKLYTAKQVMSVSSEGLESFGGQGYIEDTGLPSILRDAQVLPIWEGTTNILSLDVLRSIAKTDGQVLEVLMEDATKNAQSIVNSPALKHGRKKVLAAIKNLVEFAQDNPDKLVVAARDLAYSLARIYIGSLSLEHAVFVDASPQDIIAAQRWCCWQDLCPVVTNHQNGAYDQQAAAQDYELVMDGYEGTKVGLLKKLLVAK